MVTAFTDDTRGPVARGGLVALVIVLASGCGSTGPTPQRPDGVLAALSTYVDAEIAIAADAGACRDELARGRADISGDTAICIAGFAQTLLERADVVTTAATASPQSRTSAACATSQADLARGARATRDGWRDVIDLVRHAATADTALSAAAMKTAVAVADGRADVLITDQLGAFRQACLSGSDARRAEELPGRHHDATRRSGQTI